MMLIDVDVLMNTLCELRENAIKWLADCRAQRSAMTPRAEQAVLTFNECISQVKKSSEVDAVPVVRCRDCKHWRRQTNYAGAQLSFGFCESDDMWGSLYGETYEVSHIDTDDDFYCGYAERREDGRQ